MDNSELTRGPFTCPNCNKEFQQFSVFNAHSQEKCVPADSQPFCIIFNPTSNKNARPRKKLHLTVEEYFYGKCNGKKHKQVANFNPSKKYKCYSCAKVLKNNLRFMSHVRHKIENHWKQNDNINDFNICSHCYRHYDTPFQLQCHVETVHSSVAASTTCCICELNFQDEETFLFHMKNRHGCQEMPYVCKICSHRSSLYSDLMQHFRECHENSNSLMCPFCLCIHNTGNSHLNHVIQHLKKSYRCSRCRLQFSSSVAQCQHLTIDHMKTMRSKLRYPVPPNINDYTVFVKLGKKTSLPLKSFFFGSPTAREVLATSFPNFVDTKEKSKSCKRKLDQTLKQKLVSMKITKSALHLNLNLIDDTSEFTCWECALTFQHDVQHYIQHFQTEYKCRECFYASHCLYAAADHSETHTNRFRKEEDRIKETKINVVVSPTWPSKSPTVNSIEWDLENEEKLEENWKPNEDLPLNNSAQSGEEKTNKEKNVFKRKNPRRKQLLPQKVTFDGEDSPQNNITPNSVNTVGSSATHVPNSLSSAPKSNKKSAKKRKLSEEASATEEKPQRTRAKKKTSQLNLLSEPPANPFNFQRNGVVSLGSTNKPIQAPDSAKIKAKPFPAKPFDISQMSFGKVFASSRTLSEKLYNPSKKSNKQSTTPSKNVLKPSKQVPASPMNVAETPNPQPPVKDFVFEKNAKGKLVLVPRTLKKAPAKFEMPKPPRAISFSEVTKSSILVKWLPPIDCSVTQYLLQFRGFGIPTTEVLPPAQTMVRLVGLRSNTTYVVRMYSMYKNMKSSCIHGKQKTLGLRELTQLNKQAMESPVIILDDEDEEKDVNSSSAAPDTFKPTPVVSGATPMALNATSGTAKITPFPKNHTLSSSETQKITPKLIPVSQIKTATVLRTAMATQLKNLLPITSQASISIKVTKVGGINIHKLSPQQKTLPKTIDSNVIMPPMKLMVQKGKVTGKPIVPISKTELVRVSNSPQQTVLSALSLEKKENTEIVSATNVVDMENTTSDSNKDISMDTDTVIIETSSINDVETSSQNTSMVDGIASGAQSSNLDTVINTMSQDKPLVSDVVVDAQTSSGDSLENTTGKDNVSVDTQMSSVEGKDETTLLTKDIGVSEKVVSEKMDKPDAKTHDVQSSSADVVTPAVVERVESVAVEETGGFVEKEDPIIEHNMVETVPIEPATETIDSFTVAYKSDHNPSEDTTDIPCDIVGDTFTVTCTGTYHHSEDALKVSSGLAAVFDNEHADDDNDDRDNGSIDDIAMEDLDEYLKHI
uniref:zinc finger protein 36 isoform X3 n=1 Tax=Ciona intestinalis TaxID=7719 RepID=UPI00089DCA47|nr:zinc finger protein 36 isoform X3 [Ciona intestinalis]|eukprot:XP_018668256.1 zinc finger protein 36 isoform X3 [Ciona intestinalis]